MFVMTVRFLNTVQYYIGFKVHKREQFKSENDRIATPLNIVGMKRERARDGIKASDLFPII